MKDLNDFNLMQTLTYEIIRTVNSRLFSVTYMRSFLRMLPFVYILYKCRIISCPWWLLNGCQGYVIVFLSYATSLLTLYFLVPTTVVYVVWRQTSRMVFHLAPTKMSSRSIDLFKKFMYAFAFYSYFWDAYFLLPCILTHWVIVTTTITLK